MVKTFEQFSEQIKSKFPHLTLIYRDCNAISIFIDSEFGEFEDHYNRVFNGTKSHPERAKRNKQNKYKKACIEKYGVNNVSQVITGTDTLLKV